MKNDDKNLPITKEETDRMLTALETGLTSYYEVMNKMYSEINVLPIMGKVLGKTALHGINAFVQYTLKLIKKASESSPKVSDEQKLRLESIINKEQLKLGKTGEEK